MTGLVLNLAAAVLILEDLFVLGAFAFIIGSIMDTLDGRYSRMSGKGTPVRRLPRLDPRPDRGGGRPRRGLLALRRPTATRSPAAACLLVVLGSLMVSYTRARAEALGVECKVGIATRPVRVVILSAGLLFADERADRRRRPAAGGDLRDGRR